MRLLTILTLLYAPMVDAQSPPDVLQAAAEIEGQSIASHPAGSWVKGTDASGKELTITVTQKSQGKDGWQATISIAGASPAGPKAAAPTTVNRVYGSVSNLQAEGLRSVGSETITIAGKSLACKVFTYANGQKKWMSPEIPAGGTVKVVGPKGEPFFTLVSFGKP